MSAAESLPVGAHVAVLGAGIVGAACALELALRGHRVTLVDRAEPGQAGPSRGNAGHIASADVVPLSEPGIARAGLGMLLRGTGPLRIAPGHALAVAPWIWRFWRAGQGAARARAVAAMSRLGAESLPALEALAEAAGLRGIVARSDVLFVYDSAAARAADLHNWQLRGAAGVRWAELDMAELRALEPALAPDWTHAIRADRWGVAADPLALTEGFARAAVARGATLLRAEVTGIVPAPDGVVLRHGGGELRADAVVVAGGVWSDRLARALGDRLPLAAERGYNVTCPAPGVALGLPVVFAGRGVVATALAGGLRIGGWAEFDAADRPPNPALLARMRAIAAELFPGIDLTGAEEWMGARPATPDSVPVLGRSAASPRIVYACGHGHYGLTWSGASARIVADLLAGQEAPEVGPQFGLARFG